jgi:hypothetical protein
MIRNLIAPELAEPQQLISDPTKVRLWLLFNVLLLIYIQPMSPNLLNLAPRAL